ncbi:hypothetical protein AAFF_G00421400 [Aldrovandia affinis]|uniref:Uncharacterized protein n=1 Tax=Aldrovandia affinis TaxID=143900 RepID=A0AAD7S9R3_9TELE|nr:hypothetical protein AAFF_G00421400 [Aldrovandia affinis]
MQDRTEAGSEVRPSVHRFVFLAPDPVQLPSHVISLPQIVGQELHSHLGDGTPPSASPCLTPADLVPPPMDCRNAMEEMSALVKRPSLSPGLSVCLSRHRHQFAERDRSQALIRTGVREACLKLAPLWGSFRLPCKAQGGAPVSTQDEPESARRSSPLLPPGTPHLPAQHPARLLTSHRCQSPSIRRQGPQQGFLLFLHVVSMF